MQLESTRLQHNSHCYHPLVRKNVNCEVHDYVYSNDDGLCNPMTLHKSLCWSTWNCIICPQKSCIHDCILFAEAMAC